VAGKKLAPARFGDILDGKAGRPEQSKRSTMQTRRTALLRFICLLTLAAVALPIPSANAADLVPFKATYTVSYMGVRAGLLHFELRAAGDGRYVYETQATPGLVASFTPMKY
jgi:hypothetical protein